MPGDFTTTSNAASRSADTPVSTTSLAPPASRACAASSGVQNSVSEAGPSCSSRSAANAAWPSRPQPHRATRLPARRSMVGVESFTQPLP